VTEDGREIRLTRRELDFLMLNAEKVVSLAVNGGNLLADQRLHRATRSMQMPIR
jgi:hypothetical protein